MLKKKNNQYKFIVEAFKFIAVIILIWTFLIRSFYVPTSSMYPTIYPGDVMFGTCFSYGLFIPLTNTRFMTVKRVKRNDKIIFLSPRDMKRFIIKRVIGIGGDKLYMYNNDLYINGKLVEKTLVEDEKIRSYYKLTPERLLYKEKIEGKQHYIIIERNRMRASFPEIIVPKDHLFVMGDNRENSYDSRDWDYLTMKFKPMFVPESFVRAKPTFIWFSRGLKEEWGPPIFRFFTAIRFDRLADWIE